MRPPPLLLRPIFFMAPMGGGRCREVSAVTVGLYNVIVCVCIHLDIVYIKPAHD